MHGEERRKRILNYIQAEQAPVSGARLARQFAVSRQVIVQDIALLRAQNHNILSTSRGYLLQLPAQASRVFCVRHTDHDIQRELNLIVDCGGRIEDVFIDHAVYGKLQARLAIDSRKKAAEFVEEIRRGMSSPLKNITSGLHYHTVYADCEATLNTIENELKTHGFLADPDSC